MYEGLVDIANQLNRTTASGGFNPAKIAQARRSQQEQEDLAAQLQRLRIQQAQSQIAQQQSAMAQQSKPQTSVQKGPNGQLIEVVTQGGKIVSAKPLGQQQSTAGQTGGSMMRPGQFNTSQASWNMPDPKPMQQPKRSSSYLKAVDEGLAPGSPEFIKRIQDLNNPRSGVSVDIGQKSDPLGKFTETVLTQMSEAATTASQREYDASVGLELLKSRVQAGNETGKWAPLQTSVAAYLGTDPEGVATAQLFDVKMGDKVMQRIQQTKGAVSEKEMDYFGKISPGSDKEPFTNFVLLEIDRRAALREQDKLNYIENYIQERGNLVGFDRWYMKNHDPFKGDFSVTNLKKEYDDWSSMSPASSQGGGWSVERVD